jgi:hypothetical protein
MMREKKKNVPGSPLVAMWFKQQLVKVQQGRCYLCNKDSKLHLDHDHETGTVRAMLCFNCNAALGLAEDCHSILLGAVDYLSREDVNCTVDQRALREYVYQFLAVAQNNCCAICGKPEKKRSRRGHKICRLTVDHDHVSGRIRGLLCGRCNTTLGLVGESVTLLLSMAEYVLTDWTTFGSERFTWTGSDS